MYSIEVFMRVYFSMLLSSIFSRVKTTELSK